MLSYYSHFTANQFRRSSIFRDVVVPLVHCKPKQGMLSLEASVLNAEMEPSMGWTRNRGLSWLWALLSGITVGPLGSTSTWVTSDTKTERAGSFVALVWLHSTHIIRRERKGMTDEPEVQKVSINWVVVALLSGLSLYVVPCKSSQILWTFFYYNHKLNDVLLGYYMMDLHKVAQDCEVEGKCYMCLFCVDCSCWVPPQHTEVCDCTFTK